jgi:hypothetical protein
MFFGLPTRRPKDRPKHLPLKVKYQSSTDWEIAYVETRICPFLVILPLYEMPACISGNFYDRNTLAATDRFWIRGAGFRRDKDAHMQFLCDALGAREIMPTGTITSEPFCLMLAKIAHAYAVAELGLDSFTPCLQQMIIRRDLTDRPLLIGGGGGDEPPAGVLHDIAIDCSPHTPPGAVVVRIRLLAAIGTPTYYVVAGYRN